ncbi:MAG: (2Fe-2S)-binding protein [Candidatus Binataceae bacterium]
MSANDQDPKTGPKLSRRAFIKGAGAAAAVASLAAVKPVIAAEAGKADKSIGDIAAPPGPGIVERLGPGAQTLTLKVNGAVHRVTVEPRVTLLAALRDHLGLTGTKLVCDRGACGACTVHMDGRPVTSCMILAADARGHEITTVEGLGTPARMHPVQRAFVETDAMQCGFCTPGMVMSVAALLKDKPEPTAEDIKRAIAGNICRCGTYPHVVAAALIAAGGARTTKDPLEGA